MMRNPKTSFMQRQEAGMDKASETDGDSRNVRIARLLGYKVRKAQRRTSYWLLVNPNGDEGIELAQSEAEAWQHAPDFLGSLDAAFALPLNEGESLELHHFGDTYTARISISVSSRIAEADPPYQTGDNPARLCSEVWYEHRQKHPLVAKQEVGGE